MGAVCRLGFGDLARSCPMFRCGAKRLPEDGRTDVLQLLAWGGAWLAAAAQTAFVASLMSECPGTTFCIQHHLKGGAAFKCIFHII